MVLHCLVGQIEARLGQLGDEVPDPREIRVLDVPVDELRRELNILAVEPEELRDRVSVDHLGDHVQEGAQGDGEEVGLRVAEREGADLLVAQKDEVGHD